MREAHYHNFYEVYYLVSGTSTLLILDNEKPCLYHLKENCIVFIPPNSTHYFSYTSPSHSRILLNFTEDYINTALFDVFNSLFNTHVFIPDDNVFMENVFLKISNEAFKESVVSKELLRSYMTEFFSYFLRISDEGKKFTPFNETSPLYNVLDFISNNYSQDISLDTLAELACYNKKYFSRIFKKFMGKGYKNYIISIRMNEAAKMLLSGYEPINVISSACGFNDSNHFSTQFKKYFGVSPKQYRNQNSPQGFKN